MFVRRRVAIVLAAIMPLGMLCAQTWGADEQNSAVQKVDFATQVHPILKAHCFDCHGPDTQESGLRLDVRKRAIAGGDNGPAWTVGKSAESLLIRYVSGADPEKIMPPDGERLTDEQIEILKAWINQGADWPDALANEAVDPNQVHWAYRPIAHVAPPAFDANNWVRSPLDAFVVQKLSDAGLTPSAEADRYTLIRRLYLDLHGLPPAPEEVDAFVADESPDAYEALVDRLLDSPHFGERWGRHWLDKARYADSDGYEKDNPRPDAWRYRDWVIDAINRDLPLDQFTIEQLAGDLLPDATPMQKLATAFNRQTLTNTEGGTDQEQFRVEAVLDRVDTLGTVWLGLTVGCARCHTHKYDQITQREYYQLFAFFNNGDETQAEVPISDAEVARYQKEMAKFNSRLLALQTELDTRKAALGPAQAAWEETTKASIAAEAQNPPVYRPLTNATVSATNKKVTFETLDDGSVRVTGPVTAKAEYEIAVALPAEPIVGFRLEALADDGLPEKGPGRSDNGNFVLTEFRVETAGDASFNGAQAVKFARSEADYSQDNFPHANALVPNDKNGWAVGGAVGKDHNAKFLCAEPIKSDTAKHLRIKLVQNYGRKHVLGRFRLTAITGIYPDAALTPALREAVAVAAGDRNEDQQRLIRDHYATVDPTTSILINQMAILNREPPKSPNMSVRVIAQREKDPRNSHVLRRGDFLQPAVTVEPGTLATLQPFAPSTADKPANRLDLANWLMSRDNPLTARVLVNQIWSHLFGQGIVLTMNDFGVRGERPTHPELLDWLATSLMQDGWSRKTLIKRIVMSSTYRQASVHRPEFNEVDPRNFLLHRQNRYRVEGEIVRDLGLAVSGLLSRKVGGPSVFPPLPPDIAALSYANNFKWEESKGEDRYRRGMYTFFKRTAPHPNLTAFDCPDANITCVERRTSNTPLQALTTLNNETFTEAAQAFARRVLTDPAADDSSRLDYAYRVCVSRPLADDVREGFQKLLDAARTYYAEHLEDAKHIAGAKIPDGVAPAECAAWVATCRMLLNLDGFLMRE